MERASGFRFVHGFLVNFVVFMGSTARVLAVANARFAIRIFVILTTSVATMGLRLARDVIFRMVMAAALGFFAGGRRREMGTVFSHPGFGQVVVGKEGGSLGRLKGRTGIRKHLR